MVTIREGGTERGLNPIADFWLECLSCLIRMLGGRIDYARKLNWSTKQIAEEAVWLFVRAVERNCSNAFFDAFWPALYSRLHF